MHAPSESVASQLPGRIATPAEPGGRAGSKTEPRILARLGRILAGCVAAGIGLAESAPAAPVPNIVLVYGDDVGYGDLGCYGGRVETPHIDRLARESLRFTDAYSSSATCTPSRYSMLTGEYAFRKKGTGVLPGDAALVIDPGRATLPSVLRAAGMKTGVVGKWHLGLGSGALDWNHPITPGPPDLGFDYTFIMPATGDRVPCVYVEDRRVVGLDPADPISISYRSPFPGLPTGAGDRAGLRMDWSHGHNQAVINGVGRIGYMKGGTSALWKDEEMAGVFARQAVRFIAENKDRPFFLYFATHSIHVPRLVGPPFAGRSGRGPRGDAILEFDWQVGEVLGALDRFDLTNRTLIIVTSDNGPAIDDGYKDEAEEKLGDHKPGGPLRGGKYSLYEAGTRVPFIVRWPGRIAPGTSHAMISQVDLPATLGALAGVPPSPTLFPDSRNLLSALTGASADGRDHVVEHAGRLAIRVGDWKFIPPGPARRPAGAARRDPRSGNESGGELYNLADDPGESRNLVSSHPDRVRELAATLQRIRQSPNNE